MIQTYLWREPVWPPDNPAKTRFVRPHFRRPPRMSWERKGGTAVPDRTTDNRKDRA